MKSNRLHFYPHIYSNLIFNRPAKFGQLLSINTSLNEYKSEFIIFYLYNEFSQAGKAAAAEEAAKAVEDIARRAAVKVFLFV